MRLRTDSFLKNYKQTAEKCKHSFQYRKETTASQTHQHGVKYALFQCYSHTRASLQSWEEYPPPQNFFLISTPPFKRDYHEQNIPPLEKCFSQLSKDIPPPR